MKYMRFGGAGCFLALAFALTSNEPGLAAGRRHPIAGIAGTWNGFYQNDANAADRGPISVDVSHQSGRGLAAAVDFKGGSFTLDGRISPRHELSFSGQSDGATLSIDGLDQAFGGGFLAELHYVLETPRGTPERGLMLVVQESSDPQAPDVAGPWRGTYASGLDRTSGDVTLTVAMPATSSSRLTAELALRGVLFNCAGTIRPDGQFLLVGAGPGARFFAKGGYDAAARTGMPHALVDYHVMFVSGNLDFGQFDLTRLSVVGGR